MNLNFCMFHLITVGFAVGACGVSLHNVTHAYYCTCFTVISSLPRKTDMERKIEIYNFSARTRQLFVRLLALVKWASSASKVDKSAVSTTIVIYVVCVFVDEW